MEMHKLNIKESETSLVVRLGTPGTVIAVSDFFMEGQMEIPYGYCQCGCGRRTNLAKENHPSKGVFKGKPYKFILGHYWIGKHHPSFFPENYIHPSNSMNGNWKGGKSKHLGYSLRRDPSHHRSRSNGYVPDHILIIEKATSRPLLKSHLVHHVDGDKSNNKHENLVVCENQNYHQLLHQRKRALEACGHASWLKCVVCKIYDDPANLYNNKAHHWHRHCINNYHKKLRLMKKVSNGKN